MVDKATYLIDNYKHNHLTYGNFHTNNNNEDNPLINHYCFTSVRLTFILTGFFNLNSISITNTSQNTLSQVYFVYG